MYSICLIAPRPYYIRDEFLPKTESRSPVYEKFSLGHDRKSVTDMTVRHITTCDGNHLGRQSACELLDTNKIYRLKNIYK